MEVITTSIKIDPEFQSLIPPLAEDEYKGLEESIVKEGIRDALVVWEVPNGDMILLDGHNRFEIAAKHGGIHFDVKKMRFEDHDRERAKLWIINNQLGRRNLHLLDQGRLREEEYKITQNIGLQKRNANLKHSTIEVENLPHREAGRTRDIIGKELGVSGKQYDKIKEVNQKAAPETIQRIRDGEQSINSAWLEIKEKERKQEDISKKARVEQAEERHEAMKSSPVVSIDDIEQDRKDVAEIARSKRREIDNAINKILFIGASFQESGYSIINQKTIGQDGVNRLRNDINAAISILNKLLSAIGR